MDVHRDSLTAPFFTVPPRRLVSVEHPAVVRNPDKAVETLQGNAGIEKILNPPPRMADAPAQLLLRPEDAMSRPLKSISNVSNNVLLQVTVPKWTGRKRKRGSNEPFRDATPEPETPAGSVRRHKAKDLLRSLRDNEAKYQVRPVGRVERTHIFRGMPDFVYSTANSAFATKFRENILPHDLAKLKQFDIDMTKAVNKNTDIIPPPSFSHGDVPFPYLYGNSNVFILIPQKLTAVNSYRQNPTVKHAIGQSGNVTTINTQQPSKIATHLLPYDIPEVPSKPHENIPPIETQDPALRRTVRDLQVLFEERPAWTRRGIRNQLTTEEQLTSLRFAIPYVGYIFRSGPWRDAIIKLGVDPRSSPEYRHYQTFMFRLMPREPEVARDGKRRRDHDHDLPLEESSAAAKDPESHLFKGTLPLPLDGKIWMVRDIVDPQIASVLYPPDERSSTDHPFVRETCEPVSDGWYGNGTLAKAKTIMRQKINTLIENRQPDENEFVRIMEFPDHAHGPDDLVKFMCDPATSTKRDDILATEVRAAIKGAPIWRMKFESNRRDKGKKGKEKEAEVEMETQQEQSEGEEEEMERVEMLENEVAAALAARDAAEGDEGDEGDDDGEAEEDMDEGDEGEVDDGDEMGDEL
ncbi:hypothetical protein N7532_007747 [Penicillium argentinense]|uniref:Transcription factor IIIC subunit 5 HTH domain-containing protein n=1 Tax=Penicillium argentinense TaxID=1131581 RepID=A0A9W9EW35_9EURO|nr:uncharacterized protein N7532_007747 [Penicillium argentinense]KAJ5089063.1 hypothetical protein N7532_007747 [Penicillium argentinense]